MITSRDEERRRSGARRLELRCSSRDQFDTQPTPLSYTTKATNDCELFRSAFYEAVLVTFANGMQHH